MDRRDALKKLGLGGVAVAGASLVISSPAFADFGSTASQPGATAPTVTLVRSNANSATGTATFFPRTCPSTSPANARIDFALEEASPGALNGATIGGGGLQMPYQIGSNTGNGATVTRSFTVAWGGTKDITLKASVRYVCDAIGGGEAWTCYSANYNFTAANNGNITVDPTNPDQQSEIGECDSPAPSLL